jgi:hypothetical protein
MLHEWPDDASIQNDEAYLRLLLLPPNSAGGTSAVSSVEPAGVPTGSTSEQLIEIENLAEDLVKQNPASLPHRTTLALAALRQGRPSKAAAAYAADSDPG